MEHKRTALQVATAVFVAHKLLLAHPHEKEIFNQLLERLIAISRRESAEFWAENPPIDQTEPN